MSSNEVESVSPELPAAVPAKKKHKWAYSLEVKNGRGDLCFLFLDNENYQDYGLLTGLQLFPFHLAQYGGKRKVLDELTKWSNEWTAPNGGSPLLLATGQTLQNRYQNVARTANKLADKNGAPWGDVEEFNGESHSIRQQIFDMAVQAVEDVTDVEKNASWTKLSRKRRKRPRWARWLLLGMPV